MADYLENSKTIKELFEEKYPKEKLISNSYFCSEAIGYLNCIMEFFPTQEKWAKEMRKRLLMVMTVDAWLR